VLGFCIKHFLTNNKTYIMTKIIFIWYLVTGTIVPQDKVNDRQTYALFFEDGKVVDFAFKAEILEYIETGTFEYDEDRED
jgi:hypothetical protein